MSFSVRSITILPVVQTHRAPLRRMDGRNDAAFEKSVPKKLPWLLSERPLSTVHTCSSIDGSWDRRIGNEGWRLGGGSDAGNERGLQQKALITKPQAVTTTCISAEHKLFWNSGIWTVVTQTNSTCNSFVQFEDIWTVTVMTFKTEGGLLWDRRAFGCLLASQQPTLSLKSHICTSLKIDWTMNKEDTLVEESRARGDSCLNLMRVQRFSKDR